MTKKYILLAGYRRYNACKKLGYKTIMCKVHGEDKILNVNLNEIQLGENSRKEEHSEEMSELMQSIKHSGLLQPVVIVSIDELTEEDFVSLNLVENMQRKNLSPFEISMRIQRLQELGLNLSEIAVRLGINKDKLKGISDISSAFGKELTKDIDFIDKGTHDKKGKIPYFSAKTIVQSRMKLEDKKRLLKKVKQNEISQDKVEIITRLIRGGMDTDEAVENADKYIPIYTKVMMKRDVVEKLMKKYNLKYQYELVWGMLKGKLPLAPNDVVYEKDFESLSGNKSYINED